jgi:hypothetical protein
VTRLVIERFRSPAGRRDERVLELRRCRADDTLAGRTVWCATALPAAREIADDLRSRLDAPGGRLDVPGVEPLLVLAERLDAMLHGHPDAPGRGEAELAAGVHADGDDLVGSGVRPGDIVVLCDPLTAMLAEAIRERGAHAVWQVHPESAPAARSALDFLGPHTVGVDAYVVATGGQLAALIPTAGVVAAKEVDDDSYTGDCWTCVLADVVGVDRGDAVGGTLHPRPVVAAR